MEMLDAVVEIGASARWQEKQTLPKWVSFFKMGELAGSHRMVRWVLPGFQASVGREYSHQKVRGQWQVLLASPAVSVTSLIKRYSNYQIRMLQGGVQALACFSSWLRLSCCLCPSPQELSKALYSLSDLHYFTFTILPPWNARLTWL